MKSVSVVKRNIIANAIGGLWVLVLGLFLVPTQFKILGSEIVGLLGFFATVQLLLSIFDFGLAPTILREVASDSSPERKTSRELIQTVSLVYWIVATILALCLAFIASWFTNNWITLDKLSHEYATLTIRILALRLFFVWPLIFYINILSGMQRLDIVNTLRVFSQSTSIIGGIIILLIWRDLHTFLWWTIIISIFSLLLHIIACYRVFPKISLFPKPSLLAFKRVWRFSLDMNILSVQTMVLTQMDNLIVSYLMPLRMLGYYTGVYTINEKSLQTFGQILSAAMLPTLSADFGHGRMDWLRLRFRKYSQIVNYISVIPTVVFVFWGYDVLRVWTTLEAASAAHITLAILAIGFMLNTVMGPCYVLCVATNNTRIPRDVNWFGVGIYVIGCYVMVRNWGINGAAVAWVLLNTYYVFTLLPLTLRKILHSNPISWFSRSFLPFTALAFLCFGISRTLLAIQPFDNEIIIWGVCGVSILVYGFSGYFLLDTTLQKDIQDLVTRVMNTILSTLKPTKHPDELKVDYE